MHNEERKSPLGTINHPGVQAEDEMYMRRCIQLARCGQLGAAPNPMVGAVIVCDGRIIGEGYHRRCGGPHAEVNAVRSVRRPELLSRSTIYVSLEPCAHHGKTPPCADLIIQCGIPRVVVGCCDTFAQVNGRGIQKLRDAGREVVVGVLEEECRALNRQFFCSLSAGRPYITLKWAQSTDGFVDYCRCSEQAPAKFSTPVTQTLVHRLRATSQAIMVGTNTVLMDNPTLTNRLWPGNSPLRVTLDAHHRLSSDMHIMDGSTPTVVYDQGESLQDVLRNLHERQVRHLLVEGGPSLQTDFLRQGLWDELHIEVAPLQLGRGVSAPQLPPHAVLVDEQSYGQNMIRRYRNSDQAPLVLS